MAVIADPEEEGPATLSLFWSTCIWLPLLCLVVCVVYVRRKRFRVSQAETRKGNQRQRETSESSTYGRTSSQTSDHNEMPTAKQESPRVQRSPEAAVRSTAIRLGGGLSLSKDDLLRALLCSAAAYGTDDGMAENLFRKARQEFPAFDGFQKVHISLGFPERKHYNKFLVAYASDAIFIAFQGTQDLRDLADDLTVNTTLSPHGGKFHAGFLKRSEWFLRPNNKLDGVLQSGKRVILCGHSLGGAVAHMVLLRYLQEKDFVSTPESFPDSLFSIGFGAPHVCDWKAASIINEDENMRWRFINIVNQADPVPRLLHHMPSTLLAALKAAPTYFTECSSLLSQLGGIIGTSLDLFAGGQEPDFRSNIMQVGLGVAAYTWQNYVANCSTFRYNLERLWRRICQESPVAEFHPVGQYVFLKRRPPISPLDEWGPWRHNIEDGQNREMTELRMMEYSGKNEDIVFHTLVSYKTTLIKTSFLDNPQINTNQSSVPLDLHQLPNQETTPAVSTPKPEIISACLRISSCLRTKEEEEQHRIFIKGCNLLFLDEAIKVDGGHRDWQIMNVTDTDLELLPVGRIGLSVSEAAAFLIVTVKTAYGQANAQIIKDRMKSEQSQGTQSMLKRLVQILLLKARAPMNRMPRPEVLKQLDDIVHCATQSQNLEKRNSKLSELLVAISAGTDIGIEEKIEDANKLIKEVLEFLLEDSSGSIPSHHEPSRSCGNAAPTTWGQRTIWNKGKIATLVIAAGTVAAVAATGGGVLLIQGIVMVSPAAEAAAMAVSGSTVLATYVGVGGSAATYAGYNVYQGMTGPTDSAIVRRFLTPNEYINWLKLAIEEVSTWLRGDGIDHEAPRDNTDSTSPREAAAYEKKLLKQVEASPAFKGMVEHSCCNDITNCRNRSYHDVRLQSSAFLALSPRSPKLLMQKINIVLKTYALYKEVASEHFVAVVGAEGAGKSTFIKKVILEYGTVSLDETQLPETGVLQHTKDVKAYEVTKELCLVDFPGKNGIGHYTERWQQFTSLTNSTILFLDFEDDLKDEQKEMYNTMKQGLERDPIVAFVRVDLKFTPENDGLYTSTHFAEMKQKIAKELECDPKHIYYMSVQPNVFQTPERCEMMRKAGVVNLETFVNEVLRLTVLKPTHSDNEEMEVQETLQKTCPDNEEMEVQETLQKTCLDNEEMKLSGNIAKYRRRYSI